MRPGSRRRGTLRPAGLAALAAAAVPLAAVLLLAAAAPVGAQEDARAPTLPAVEATADSGQLERARELLRRWRSERAPEAELEELRRGELLAARLAEDADSARRRYARLAVEAGGEVGARARLRLAQLHLAEGAAGPALRQLELVRSDVPGHALADESWLWTGRARLAQGDTASACEALRRAAGRGGELRDRAARAAAACGLEPAAGPVEVAAGDEEPADGDAGDGDAAPAGEEDGGAGDDAEGGREDAPATGWSVQAGAFSEPASAGRMRERLREAGFEARRLPPGPDGLHRVRVGRWAERSAAEAAARSMRREGFRVIVVEARPDDAGP